MDPVTHTLVGVTLGNAFFRRRTGRESVPVLALASNLPDLDGVVMLTGHPATVAFRRTFGHSLFLVPVWSLLLALLLRRYYPRLRLPTLFGLTLLGAVVHLFFDLINSFGVVLLWPFSDWRPELATVFIVDLFLTSLLALPLLLALVPRLRRHLAPLSRAATAAVAIYLFVCSGGRALAGEALAREAACSTRAPDFVYIFPEALGPHRWRGVIREGEAYRVYLVHSFSGKVELKDRVETHPADEEVVRARRTSLGRRLDGFFKAPVWHVRRNLPEGGGLPAEAAEVTASDLRFRSLVLDRPPVFTFCFRVPPRGDAELCR
jgi:inner membrane protein